MKKFMLMLLTMLMIVFCSAPMNVLASNGSDTFNENKKGSISVSLYYPDTKEPIENAGISIYRVGNVTESDNKINYTLIAGYKESGAVLTCDEDGNFKPETAIMLADYVNSKGITGVSAKTDDSGSSFVGNCSVGVYLVTIQPINRAGEKFFVDPFILSVPIVQEDEFIYAVSSNPKVSIDFSGIDPDAPTKEDDNTVPDVTTTTDPDNPEDPDNPNDNPYDDPDNININGGNSNNITNNPTKPSQLPNTGMLKWPIPVFATLGPLLFAYGYLDVINRKSKDEN